MDKGAQTRVLVVEPDATWRQLLAEELGETHDLSFLTDGKGIYEALEIVHQDLMILDLHLRKDDPFKILESIRTERPHLPVIMTGRMDTDSIVKAIQAGAFDVVTKPYLAKKIGLAVQKTMETLSLQGELHYLRHEQDIIYDFNRIIAESQVMKRTLEVLKKFAATDATIPGLTPDVAAGLRDRLAARGEQRSAGL